MIFKMKISLFFLISVLAVVSCSNLTQYKPKRNDRTIKSTSGKTKLPATITQSDGGKKKILEKKQASGGTTLPPEVEGQANCSAPDKASDQVWFRAPLLEGFEGTCFRIQGDGDRKNWPESVLACKEISATSVLFPPNKFKTTAAKSLVGMMNIVSSDFCSTGVQYIWINAKSEAGTDFWSDADNNKLDFEVVPSSLVPSSLQLFASLNIGSGDQLLNFGTIKDFPLCYLCSADFNECADPDTHNCNISSKAICRNTAGSFLCQCPAGFEPMEQSGKLTCRDIDECKSEDDDPICAPLETCQNMPGGFECQCKMDYERLDNGTCAKEPLHTQETPRPASKNETNESGSPTNNGVSGVSTRETGSPIALPALMAILMHNRFLCLYTVFM